MEDIPRNLEKNLMPPGPTNQDKNKRDWQILFIDDRGRIVPIRQFKTLVAVVMSLLTISIIFAVTFFLLYINNRGGSYATKDEIAHYKSQIKSLQNELDILTAKMVLSESLNKTDSKENKTPKSDLKRKTDTENRVSKTIEKKDTPEKRVSTKEPEKQKPSPPPPETLPELEAKDFAFTHITYKNILRIRFIIRNVDKRIRTVSGYIFLILKENEKDPHTWLTIPAVDLVAGKPSQIGRGQYFKISNYKTVHFKLNNIENPQRYPNAELFVFDRKGKVVLKTTEPVVIKTIEGIKPAATPENNEEDEQEASDESTPEETEEEVNTADPQTASPTASPAENTETPPMEQDNSPTLEE